MLTICLFKLISILLYYKVKYNFLQWIRLPRDVRGKVTNKLYFFEKKKEKHPADIMLNKTYVNPFSLSPRIKRKCCQKKFWLGLKFCRLLQDLQLQYLQMSGNFSSVLINDGNFVNNHHTLFCRSKASLEIQQRLKSQGFSTKFYTGRLRPEFNPLPFYIPLPYTSTEWNPNPPIYLKPENGTPFRVEPLRIGHFREYPPRFKPCPGIQVGFEFWSTICPFQTGFLSIM